MWLFAEDLRSALIGPFASDWHADEHIAFCRCRGDAAIPWLVTLEEGLALHPGLVITPAEDRDYDG
jgi:hypothetical protein